IARRGEPLLPRLPRGRVQPQAVDEDDGSLGAGQDVLPPQLVAWAACSMTCATLPGLEIMDRCPAYTRVMWALARWAMNVSAAGGMTWSAVPIHAAQARSGHEVVQALGFSGNEQAAFGEDGLAEDLGGADRERLEHRPGAGIEQVGAWHARRQT